MKKLNSNFSRSFIPKKWHAYWMWGSDDGRQRNAFYFFRKEFIIENLRKEIMLHISAESEYLLYINGKYIERGAPPSQNYYKYYDSIKVKKYLNPGKNCIGIIVYNRSDFAGLLVELMEKDDRIILISDDTWKMIPAICWNKNTMKINSMVYQEIFDSRLLPENWNVIGFNDSSWIPTTIIKKGFSRIWTKMIPRSIPFLEETFLYPRKICYTEECLDIINRRRPDDLSIALSTVGHPIKHSVLKNEKNLLQNKGSVVAQCSIKHTNRIFDGIYDPCIILDFGKIITGYIILEINGVDGGVVDIGYAERLLDGRFNNSIEVSFADRYIMKHGKNKYTSFFWKSFRFIKIRVSSCQKPIKILSVKANHVTYPFEEKGKFHCNKEVYNKIFNICKNTLRLCSKDYIMDTPWREQSQWIGDASAVTIPGIYACFGDDRLPEKFYKQSQINQNVYGLMENTSNTNISNNLIKLKGWSTIVDFSLYWINGIWEHYLYTGKEELIHEAYPVICKNFQSLFCYVNDYGMLEDLPFSIFLDHAYIIEKYGVEDDARNRGESTCINALFYGTLCVVLKMARFKNDIYFIQCIEELLKTIKENFTLRFYNDKLKCFCDMRTDNTLITKISEHANCTPILYGLCDNKLANDIVNKFYVEKSLKYNIECEPFYSSFMLKALHRINKINIALDLIEERWGKRMVARGETSTTEEWGRNGSFRNPNGGYKGIYRSLSHAWSAFPAEFFIKYLIGLEIVEAGCKKVKLNPFKVKFNYEVVFPTIHGLIKIRKKEDDINIEYPNNIVVLEED